MGTGLSIAIAAVFSIFSLLSRPFNMLLGLLFIFVFFAELGQGFTSFNGSIFFNQAQTNLFRIKLIEIILAASYFITLFTYKRANNDKIMSFDRKLTILFFILVGILTVVGIWNGHGVNIIGWRFIISGLIFAHLLYIVLDTEEKILKFVKYLILFMFARAIIGLVMYAVGHGVISPRGNVPFFWDSRQVAAFAFGSILIANYIFQYKTLSINHKIFSKWLAYLILCTFIVTVLLSIRRTSWAFVAVGIGVSLFTTKKVNITHYIGLFLTIALVITTIMFVPQLKGIKNNLAQHVASLNIFEQSVAKQQANAVHIDNVEEYSKIILNDNAILMFGFIGRQGDNFNQFEASFGNEFLLGKAHNGLLRSTLIFGLGGTLIYILMYFHIIIKTKKILSIPENNQWLWIAKGSLIFLGLQFGSALTFVPPFYTSVKGNVYTFIPLFFIYAALYYYNKQEPEKQESSEIPDYNNRILSYKK